jgi:hypothetical protein
VTHSAVSTTILPLRRNKFITYDCNTILHVFKYLLCLVTSHNDRKHKLTMFGDRVLNDTWGREGGGNRVLEDAALCGTS